MTTVPASVTADPSPLLPSADRRALLRRVDARIVALRRAIRHDHRDAPFWLAFGMPAATAQAHRARLRRVADLLHLARAVQRNRLHGTRFATLDAQQTWLRRHADVVHRCGILLDEAPPDRAT